jgi:hypothetical protein
MEEEGGGEGEGGEEEEEEGAADKGVGETVALSVEEVDQTRLLSLSPL